MLDFHSHVLPKMDDGSDSVETSNQILECLEKQGVDTLCLTSHFYPMDEDIKEYLKRREESFHLFNYQGNIKLCKGAEVYYYRGISYSDEIDRLCLENTDFLLLELPWGHRIDFSEILSLNNQLSVVLAHIERYLDLYSIKEISELSDRGIYLQSNLEVFNEKDFGSIRRLFEDNKISFVGSDCHNLTNRRPIFDKFQAFIIEKYGKAFYNNYVDQMNRVFWGRTK